MKTHKHLHRHTHTHIQNKHIHTRIHKAASDEESESDIDTNTTNKEEDSKFKFSVRLYFWCASPCIQFVVYFSILCCLYENASPLFFPPIIADFKLLPLFVSFL